MRVHGWVHRWVRVGAHSLQTRTLVSGRRPAGRGVVVRRMERDWHQAAHRGSTQGRLPGASCSAPPLQQESECASLLCVGKAHPPVGTSATSAGVAQPT